MSLRRIQCLVIVTCLTTLPLAAQQPEGGMDAEQAAMMDAYMKAGAPGEPHARLAAGEGTWKMVVRSWMDPSAPPMESEGVSEQKMILDGRVLEQRIQSDMMGMPFDGLGHMGYDNTTGEYWSSWMDSMSTGCFMSRGTYDEAAGAITLHGEYPDPVGGDSIAVRAVSRQVSDDEHVFEWYESREGAEMKTMEIVYTRQ